MKTSSKILILTFFAILLLNTFIGCSQTYNEKEYELQISVKIWSKYMFSIQHSPITVVFELKNIGNKTFNGELTLVIMTPRSGFMSNRFEIVNLTKNDVYENSMSFVTDEEGRYWPTIKIEANDLSRIRLYSNSKVIDQGNRVSAHYSTYVYPLEILYLIVSAFALGLGAVGGVPQIRRWMTAKPKLKIVNVKIEEKPAKNILHLEVRNEKKWWRRDCDATDVAASCYVMDKDYEQWIVAHGVVLSPYLMAGAKVSKEVSIVFQFKPEGNPHTIVVRVTCLEGLSKRERITYSGS